MGLGNFIFFGFGIVSLGFGFYYLKKVRQTEDVPTSKISKAPQGHVELSGKAVALDLPTFRNQQGQKVIYRKYQVHEEVQKGDSKEWQLVHERTYGSRFYLKDESGIAEVLLEGFDLEIPQRTFPYSELQDDQMISSSRASGNSFGIMEVLGTILSGQGRMRVTEWSLPTNSPIFLHGHYRTNLKSALQEQVFATITPHKESPSFLTTQSEKSYILFGKIRSFGFIAVGAGFIYVALTLDFVAT